MKTASPTERPGPAWLIQTWQELTEQLGVDPTDPLCRNIERLGTAWNDELYLHVCRALDHLRRARGSMLHRSDRMPPPSAFEEGVLLGGVPLPGGKVTRLLVSPLTFPLPTVICGLPGSGKTWLARLILAAAYPTTRILVFDPNRSYRLCCGDSSDWLSIDWQTLRLNPLVPPPDYGLEAWLSEKLDQLARGELLHSRYLLARRLDELLEAATRRAEPGEPFPYPSLFDLRDDLAHRKCRPGSKEEMYRESALNVLDGRIRSTQHVFDCAQGMEKLVTNTRVRIDTEGLSPVPSVDFFITHLMHYVCRARAHAVRNEPPPLHTLILLEEAQTLLESRSINITFYQELLLVARALGVGFLFIVQDISRIDPIVLAACANYFVFSQSSANNKRVVRDLLSLSPRECDLLGNLVPGECFVRFTQHPRFSYPFLARILPYE